MYILLLFLFEIPVTMHRLTKTINRGTKVEPIPSHSQTSFSIDRQDRLKVSSWNLPKTKNVPSIEVIQPGTEQGMQSPIQGAHELQMMSHSSENADSSMSSVSLELDRRSSILPSVSNGAGALDVPDDIKDGEFSDGSSVSSTSYSSFSANLLRAYGLPVMFPTRSTRSVYLLNNRMVSTTQNVVPYKYTLNMIY